MKFSFIHKTSLLLIMIQMTIAPTIKPVCAAETLLSTDKDKYGGELIIGSIHKSEPLDPLRTSASIAVPIMNLVFSSLFHLKPNGELAFDLIQSVEEVNEFVQIYHLRRGVLFHDGTELTSKDVEFSFLELKDPSFKSVYRSDAEVIDRVEIIDRHTIKFVFNQPFNKRFPILKHYVIPKHIYQNRDSKPDLAYRPIGSGMFKFKEWKEDDEIVLEVNSDYYKGRAYFDKIIFRAYPNKALLSSAFMKGQVDIVQFLTLSDYRLINEDDTFETFSYPLPAYYVIIFDLNNPIQKDINVRDAFCLAVNRTEFINRIEDGYGDIIYGPYESNKQDVQDEEYDPLKAIQLLEESGWVLDPSDNVRKKDGEPLEIRLLIYQSASSSPVTPTKLEYLLRQQMQAIGMKLQVQYINFDKLLEKSEVENYSSALLTQKIMYRPDQVFSIKEWHSNSKSSYGAWSKHAFYDHLDSLIDSLRQAPNFEAKEKLLIQINDYVINNRMACFLYSPYWFHTARKNIGNVEKYLQSNDMLDYLIKDLYRKKQET